MGERGGGGGGRSGLCTCCECGCVIREIYAQAANQIYQATGTTTSIRIQLQRAQAQIKAQ